MGNVTEMMAGGGLSPAAAKAWVGTSGTATAAGSDNTDAGSAGVSGVVTVSGADGTTGVILNALPDGSSQILVNTAGSVLKVYPNSGASINGLTATTGAYTLGVNQAGIFVKLTSTTWAAIGEEA